MSDEIKMPDPGIYRLSEDLKNPNQDLRKVSFWSRGRFSKGTYFVVEHADSPVKINQRVHAVDVWFKVESTHKRRVGTLISVDGGERSHDFAAMDEKEVEMVRQIINLLEPVKEHSFESIWATRDTSGEDPGRPILKLLVQNGRITLNELRSMIEGVNDFSIYDEIGEQDDG